MGEGINFSNSMQGTQETKPAHPAYEDTLVEIPETAGELTEACELAGVTSERDAAVRGLRYAREQKDFVLENNFRAVLLEQPAQQVSYLTAAGRLKEAEKIIRETRELIGSDEQYAIIAEKLEIIDRSSIYEIVGKWLDLDDHLIIKRRAMKLMEESQGVLEPFEALRMAYAERIKAKEGIRPVILVKDNNGIIYRANSYKEAIDIIVRERSD